MDMLVKLYDLDYSSLVTESDSGTIVKRASIVDKERILAFVRQEFPSGEAWANECESAILAHPPTCFIATQNKEVVGFACFDATAKGFFGPTGIKTACRKQGIGHRLLLRTLAAMKESGYGYAVIGWVDEAVDFYRKTVGAIPIEDSAPEKSVYRNLIAME